MANYSNCDSRARVERQFKNKLDRADGQRRRAWPRDQDGSRPAASQAIIYELLLMRPPARSARALLDAWLMQSNHYHHHHADQQRLKERTWMHWTPSRSLPLGIRLVLNVANYSR